MTRKALDAAPDNLKLQVAFGDASLRAGRKEEGVAELRKVGESADDGQTLNSVAWALADTSTAAALAQIYAEKSASKLENDSADVSLNSLEIGDLQRINSLGAASDTLGWAYFRLGELDKAQPYVNVAWMLLQHGICADHLGQIYEAQGKRQEAQHAYEMNWRWRPETMETHERSRKLGGEVHSPVVLKNGMRLGLVKPRRIPPRTNWEGSAPRQSQVWSNSAAAASFSSRYPRGGGACPNCYLESCNYDYPSFPFATGCLANRTRTTGLLSGSSC